MIAVTKIVPVLRINNRKNNQAFLEEVLGMKTILEEAAFAEFAGHQQDQAQIVLMESPSMRTRAVRGIKKLNQITVVVSNPLEIEGLLARGAQYTKLYQGENGYAFETFSPEGDRYLLHSEKDKSSLREIEAETFTQSDSFEGLTHFTIEEIIINTPTVAESEAFYRALLGPQSILQFRRASGEDLLVSAEETWDLESLRLELTKDSQLETIESVLSVDYFKDKKGRFLQTTDPSQIDVWFDK